MKYTLTRLEDYQKYINTLLPYSETLPTVDGYNFDESTGIMTVNRTRSSSEPFFIYVPVRNLKIGDKIKARVDVRKLEGEAGATLGTTLTSGIVARGSEGIHRQSYSLSHEISDFETISMEAIYEGHDIDTLQVSNDNDGILYVAFRMSRGYGSSHIQFKNLSVVTESNISGITPGTKIYHGMLKYIPGEGFSFVESKGSSDIRELSLTETSLMRIKFYRLFEFPPTAHFTTMFQTSGNNCLYEIVLNTTNTSEVLFYVRDLVNNQLVTDYSTITVPLYVDFTIIGE